MASERREGPTPSGGSYAIAYFMNDKGEETPKDRSTEIRIVEYDKNGVRLAEHYTRVGSDDE